MARSIYGTPVSGGGSGGVSSTGTTIINRVRKGLRNFQQDTLTQSFIPVIEPANKTYNFPDVNGQWLYFDSRNPDVLKGAAAFTNTWSISVWVRLTSAQANMVPLSFSVGSGVGDIYFQYVDARFRVGIRPNGGTVFNEIKDGNTAITTGTWYLWTLVYTGSVGTFRWFVNGTEQSASNEASGTPPNVVERSMVGGFVNLDNQFNWEGDILYPAVWDVALPDAAITQLASSLTDPRTNTGNYTQSSDLVWLESPLTEVQGVGTQNTLTNMLPLDTDYTIVADTP